jgi:hypothetical protein
LIPSKLDFYDTKDRKVWHKVVPLCLGPKYSWHSAGNFSDDRRAKHSSDETVFVISVATTKIKQGNSYDDADIRQLGLVLKISAVRPGVYKRIGLMWVYQIDGSDWFSGANIESIEII